MILNEQLEPVQRLKLTSTSRIATCDNALVVKRSYIYIEMDRGMGDVTNVEGCLGICLNTVTVDFLFGQRMLALRRKTKKTLIIGFHS